LGARIRHLNQEAEVSPRGRLPVLLVDEAQEILPNVLVELRILASTVVMR
jgi:hypothetical protein